MFHFTAAIATAESTPHPTTAPVAPTAEPVAPTPEPVAPTFEPLTPTPAPGGSLPGCYADSQDGRIMEYAGSQSDMTPDVRPLRFVQLLVLRHVSPSCCVRGFQTIFVLPYLPQSLFCATEPIMHLLETPSLIVHPSFSHQRPAAYSAATSSHTTERNLATR